MNRQHFVRMGRRQLLKKGLHLTGLALVVLLVSTEVEEARARTPRALRTKRPGVHAEKIGGGRGEERPVGSNVASGRPEEWLKPDNGDGGRGKDDGYRPVI